MNPNITESVQDDNAKVERECPQCGKDSIATYWHDDTFTYGSGDSAVMLRVDLPVRRCAACELEFLDDEGSRLRDEAVYRHFRIRPSPNPAPRLNCVAFGSHEIVMPVLPLKAVLE